MSPAQISAGTTNGHTTATEPHRLKLMICGSSQGAYGGIEAVMFALADAARDSGQFDVRIVFKLVKSASTQASLEDAIGSCEHDCHIVRRTDPRLLTWIHESDLVHVQNVPPDILACCKLLGKPLVSTIHNYRRPRFCLHRLLWDTGVNLCDFVTFNSAFVRSTWDQGNPNRRHHVVPAVCRLPERQSPGGKRRGFAFISRWIPNKGADTLIKAYNSARLDRENWPLVMMGEGPELSRIRKDLIPDGGPGIELLGRVDDHEKWHRIAAAKWMVVPPHTLEDMGLTPIEARTLGTPVIASRDGGLTESAGKDALFFEPGNVEALSHKLEEAACMDETSYLTLAEQAQQSLDSYLLPFSFYHQLYHRATQAVAPQPPLP